LRSNAAKYHASPPHDGRASGQEETRFRFESTKEKLARMRQYFPYEEDDGLLRALRENHYNSRRAIESFKLEFAEHRQDADGLEAGQIVGRPIRHISSMRRQAALSSLSRLVPDVDQELLQEVLKQCNWHVRKSMSLLVFKHGYSDDRTHL
jgi:hypothetical protein